MTNPQRWYLFPKKMIFQPKHIDYCEEHSVSLTFIKKKNWSSNADEKAD